MGLQEFVPPHDPTQDAALAVGFASLTTIPIVGGPVVEIASGLLASRQQQRQHEYNVMLAKTLEDLLREADGWSAEAVLNSDEFMAAYEKTARFAAESESQEHRLRLARAAAQMGDWSPVNKAMRRQMLAWVTEMDDSHVRALKFLDDPRAFIAKVDDDPSRLPHALNPGISLSSLIGEWVYLNQPGWADLTRIVSRFLNDNGLAQIPSQSTMSVDGALSCHTTELGRSLLHFIETPSS
ncbi:hypothetical protein ACRAWB_01915 [Leifsonia poae]|uniref:hypothetical protein n=1 Tax=Leifsonia poae TaxID=110933 RepID=UPI003D693384